MLLVIRSITLTIAMVSGGLLGASELPLKLVQTWTLPAAIKGGFDHLTVDVKGGRLFLAAERHGSVEVLDLKTRKIIHSIKGLGRPHAICYRADLDRLYITDGTEESGALWIFDGKTYQEIRKLDLLAGTDSIVYDADTKYLYVTYGGDDAKLPYSLIAIVNTNTSEKIGDIKIDSDTIAAMRLDGDRPIMYLDEADKSRQEKTIAIIDRDKREKVANWPVPGTKKEGAMALDVTNHRLFSGTVEGVVVVFDTQTGKPVQRLPICKGTDDMAYDAKSKRLYSACDDGEVDVYRQITPDRYNLVGKVRTGPGGRTATLVPDISRYFVAVPQHGNANAAVLEYQVQE